MIIHTVKILATIIAASDGYDPLPEFGSTGFWMGQNMDELEKNVLGDIRNVADKVQHDPSNSFPTYELKLGH